MKATSDGRLDERNFSLLLAASDVDGLVTTQRATDKRKLVNFMIGFCLFSCKVWGPLYLTLYNQERPHQALGYLVPAVVHAEPSQMTGVKDSQEA